MSAATLLAAALAAEAAGLSVVPPGLGKKHPTISWRQYQSRRATPAEIRTMYGNGCGDGLGLVTGRVSGGLELIEFDDGASAYTPFVETAAAVGLGDLVERIVVGYSERSPSGGIHLLYRCADLAGSAKLAIRPKRPEEQKDPNDTVQVLIETRGDPGYVVVAPSAGRDHKHPPGSCYQILRGGFDTIATITPHERRALHDLARTFDELPQPERPPERAPATTGHDGERPGDDFNRRAGWAEILEPHGWRHLHTRGEVEYWGKPGATNREHHATVGHGHDKAGNAALYVFSTATVFEPERTYSKFAAWALLNHDGDFRAAAKDLADRGYGEASGRLGGGRVTANLDEANALAARDSESRVAGDARRTTLPDVVTVFRRWLDLPDLGALYVTLATPVANRMRGDPVWLMEVGAPGSGKTELIQSVRGLPNVHHTATITSEGALLSATPNREKAKQAKGGLLREIGAFGILLCKDFTSILSMNRDTRAAVLAALREIYDGSWTRHVGTDGGKTLHWEGKVGVIAGVTPTIDSHHAVIGSMGERFVFYRLPPVNERDQSRRAITHVGREEQMRAELAAVVADFFAGLDIPDIPPALPDDDRDRLIDVATLAVRCRSAVERDPRTREIELIPQPEAPARMAITLVRLLAALTTIGVDRAAAWQLTTKVALDSMPAVRRAVLVTLVAAAGQPKSTTAVAIDVGYPNTTTRRALEDLAAHGVACRESQGKGRPDLWSLSEWARERWAATVPEKSVGGSASSATANGVLENPSPASTNFSGTPPPTTDPSLLTSPFADEQTCLSVSETPPQASRGESAPGASRTPDDTRCVVCGRLGAPLRLDTEEHCHSTCADNDDTRREQWQGATA